MSCDLMRNFLDFFVIVEKNVSENGESIKNNPNWDIWLLILDPKLLGGTSGRSDAKMINPRTR